ncbi:MAG: patatin-like phospholipase family protein [Lentisphaeria bacterium]|nr:patatin-like phospholipase family protein [Candidatus Neomarinimicrobiota bacterium]MCF7841505.1 patatin-like phospholipase family protein [Lentisphaeria bacterium]
MPAKPVLGLALGGGGARGFAHIGVLQVLAEAGIRPDIIAGSSFGSVVGGLYIKHGDVQGIIEDLLALFHSDLYQNLGVGRIHVQDRQGGSFWHQVARFVQDRIVINLAQSRPGLIRLDKLRQVTEFLITEDRWVRDGVSLGVVATDLKSGEDVYFTSGDLVTAILASSAIPGFVPPVQVNGRTLVDGGVTQQVPVRLARKMGADVVVAVDVGQSINADAPIDNAMAIMSQAEGIKSYHYRMLLNRESDVVIMPPFIGIHWSEFDRTEEFVQAGRTAAETHLEEIHQALWRYRHPWLSRLRRFAR